MYELSMHLSEVANLRAACSFCWRHLGRCSGCFEGSSNGPIVNPKRKTGDEAGGMVEMCTFYLSVCFIVALTSIRTSFNWPNITDKHITVSTYSMVANTHDWSQELEKTMEFSSCRVANASSSSWTWCTSWLHLCSDGFQNWSTKTRNEQIEFLFLLTNNSDAELGMTCTVTSKDFGFPTKGWPLMVLCGG